MEVGICVKLLRSEYGEYIFYCRGCESCHLFDSRWQFNNDLSQPTFSPSLLVKYTIGDEQHICHSFVREGNMEYLSDCTHKFAGMTVPLLDESEWYKD